jgi:hypothetical protein
MMFSGNKWRYLKVLGPIVAGLPMIFACPTRPMEMPRAEITSITGKIYPQSPEKDVDILFVIDNSSSMDQEQKNLRQNFPKLIEALRSYSLGPEVGVEGAICTKTNTSGCAIPNVHIGVISSDLGAGPYGYGACAKSQGDEGRLTNSPKTDGCIAPNDAYITYADGVTNVADGSASGVDSVKQALSCIAKLGTEGCGFEHHLEAAYWALDGGANRNPGFIREDALLAIVVIADEDDCSARRQDLFDQDPRRMEELGPLNFRCFKQSVNCDGAEVSHANEGPLNNCVAKTDEEGYLHPIKRYSEFFKGLKDDGRVLFTAIIGPNSPVFVEQGTEGAALEPSCSSDEFGLADPGIRIKSLVDDFGDEGAYSNICAGDFGPPMKTLGEKIVGRIGGQCIAAPPLTRSGAIACKAGTPLGTNSKGESTVCSNDSLAQVDCTIQESTRQNKAAEWKTVEKCSDALFNSDSRDCAGECPCWRLAAKTTCVAESVGSPYGLEILREGDKEPEKGTVAKVSCHTSGYKWGTKEFADLPQGE